MIEKDQKPKKSTGENSNTDILERKYFRETNP